MGALRIIHVAFITLEPMSGMGRIACEWRAAAQRNGIDFVHIGVEEVGPVRHRLLFPPKARKLAESLATDRTVLLIHEPCGWAFRGMPCPKVGFSHGIELRAAEVERTFQDISLKSKMTQPFMLWLGKRSLTAMDALLVSNTDDRNYLAGRGLRAEELVRVFRNGIDPVPTTAENIAAPDREKTIVFNASWLRRKGTNVLIKAAVALAAQGIRPRWLLIGGGVPKEEILADWPEALHADLTIIPAFQRSEELTLISQAEIFVLPSYFEGQPLSLLQAMSVGLCCITSDCCGQKDIIRHGENGLLFAPGRELELATLIGQVWSDSRLRYDLGRKASDSMADRTWAQATDELMGWLGQAGDSAGFWK